MALTNLSKPTTSLTNSTRPPSGELWSTWITSWATETRTWDELASLMDNISKPSTSMTNLAKPV